jgi:hypothetical protein
MVADVCVTFSADPWQRPAEKVTQTRRLQVTRVMTRACVDHGTV